MYCAYYVISPNTHTCYRIVVRIDSWDVDSLYPNGHFVRSIGPIGNLETETNVILIEHELTNNTLSKALLRGENFMTSRCGGLQANTEIGVITSRCGGLQANTEIGVMTSRCGGLQANTEIGFCRVCT